jgi:hypothetical protein
MNSWEIIKNKFIDDSKPQTLKRNIVVNQAASLFISLRHCLSDYEIAVSAFNKDGEVRDAILAKAGIDELRKAGVLR